MEKYIQKSAASLARAIRAKEISCRELVEACLSRVEEVNPKLNAVVQLAADSARAEARKADEDLAKGNVRGPLHGVPFTLKDSIDTAGVITAAGTKGRANFVPETDAVVASRLKGAGAILLGKTNTPELTLSYETDNLVYGRTKNPYDIGRSPGGSSGGAAAIVAACGSVFDAGSDTAGSVRIPAHFCGVAGLKPTSGRVPRTGHIVGPEGHAESLTTLGPLARRVEDLQLIYSVLAGPDGRDPHVAPVPVGDPAEVAFAKLRVAFFTDNGLITPTREIVDTVQAAARALDDAGLRVEEAVPEGIAQTSDLFISVFGADGGAGIRAMLERAGTTEPHRVIAKLLKRLEAEPVSGAEFGARMLRWDGFRRTMLGFLAETDVIVCPVNPRPALSNEPLDEFERFHLFSYTQVFNLTGWPAATVRCGTSPEGLPIGVQVAGRPWREDTVLAVASFLEEKFGGWQPSPLFP